MTSLGAPLARGSRSIVHEWGSNAVAKVPLPGTPEGWIRFEANYATTVSQSDLPVPRVLGIERVNGREVSIFERVNGPTMWESLLAEPTRAPRFGEQLAELHLQVMSVAPLITLPSQHARVVAKLREAARSHGHHFTELIDAIPTSTSTAVLCHGDFHPKNIILAPSGPVIVDWFDACRGDALGDIARTSLLLGTGFLTSDNTYLPGAGHADIRTLHDRYLEIATEAINASPEQLNQWRHIQAAARIAERAELSLNNISNDVRHQLA
jgi:Ser/Thr protein kinase RdoA (MazF antagonist)